MAGYHGPEADLKLGTRGMCPPFQLNYVLTRFNCGLKLIVCIINFITSAACLLPKYWLQITAHKLFYLSANLRYASSLHVSYVTDTSRFGSAILGTKKRCLNCDLCISKVNGQETTLLLDDKA